MKVSVLLSNFVAKTCLCSFWWLYLSLCFAVMFTISPELGHHSVQHQCWVVTEVIIVWSLHFTKDDWWTEATTESTNHQKVEATNFVETHEVKKATSFEKLHEMKKEKKKEHLRQPIASQFKSEDISCVEKHYLPQNTKHLKGKKRRKGNIWKRWVCLFFCWSNIFFSEKKCISMVEWRKKKISTVGVKNIITSSATSSSF